MRSCRSLCKNIFNSGSRVCEGYRAAECPPRGDVDVQEVPRPTAASKLPPMACRNAGSLDCDRGLACTGGSNTTATTAAAAGELPNSVVPTSFFNSAWCADSTRFCSRAGLYRLLLLGGLGRSSVRDSDWRPSCAWVCRGGRPAHFCPINCQSAGPASA